MMRAMSMVAMLCGLAALSAPAVEPPAHAATSPSPATQARRAIDYERMARQLAEMTEVVRRFDARLRQLALARPPTTAPNGRQAQINRSAAAHEP